MVEYTTYLPKELFFNGVSGLQVLIGIAIILIVVFLIYKFYEFSGTRKKPELF